MNISDILISWPQASPGSTSAPCPFSSTTPDDIIITWGLVHTLRQLIPQQQCTYLTTNYALNYTIICPPNSSGLAQSPSKQTHTLILWPEHSSSDPNTHPLIQTPKLKTLTCLKVLVSLLKILYYTRDLADLHNLIGHRRFNLTWRPSTVTHGAVLGKAAFIFLQNPTLSVHKSRRYWEVVNSGIAKRTISHLRPTSWVNRGPNPWPCFCSDCKCNSYCTFVLHVITFFRFYCLSHLVLDCCRSWVDEQIMRKFVINDGSNICVLPLNFLCLHRLMLQFVLCTTWIIHNIMFWAEFTILFYLNLFQ